ncbi:hypothetical protein [Massilia sp. S19_KUP03_FR1]|uniref:hypothetical protein n=1 Tax=Massilia sp. S19_KUP03_FR1 TaxID=3025503 RepID=UPI002FCDBF6E
MRTDQHGLSTPTQVEALADQLSACADQLHARLQDDAAAIAAMPDDNPARAQRRAAAKVMLDAEQTLRQRADGLYADAAGALVAGLGAPQRHVIALTAAAAEKIRKIALIGDAAGLVAGLLALVALDTIRVQLAAVKANLPPKQ